GRVPKIFVGFSDATFVLNALVDHSHMVSFHGPMVATDMARGLSVRASTQLQRLLSGAPGLELRATEAMRAGTAEGPLIGGCLSIIVATMATPWQPVFDGRILFLEDIGEKAYRIDRMLVQLRQAGVFERVAGIIFGALQPVVENPQEHAQIAE